MVSIQNLHVFYFEIMALNSKTNYTKSIYPIQSCPSIVMYAILEPRDYKLGLIHLVANKDYFRSRPRLHL